MAVPEAKINPQADADDATFSLAGYRVMATLPAADIERARRFYGEKLGLIPVPGAAPAHYLYHCGGATFSLYETSGRASGTHQQMGFSVSDLDAVVRVLRARGVAFTGDIAEDERTRTAWFKDSEDNVLMLREILACPSPH
jgi:predicted enzyme related to lactoylglutathione lyase